MLFFSRTTHDDIRNTTMAWKQPTYRTNKRRKTHLDSISKRMLFTWLMLAGLIMILAPHQWTNQLQFAFLRIFRWPLGIGSEISLASSTKQQSSSSSNQTIIQYQNHIDNLEQNLEQANQRITQLAGIRNRFPLLKGAKLATADKMQITLNGTQAELIINRGTDEGLASNQFVMADNCIIGTITEVSKRIARVKLCTDKKSNIAVKVGKSEIKRMMQGAGNISAKVLNLQTTHDVKVGDNVIACKEPGLLDVPMIIGTVTQCEKDAQQPSVWDITVQPACDIMNIDSVTVIIMNP